LDYDGTLAPIVADPAAARPVPGAPEVLTRLARTFGLVAVVSGRPVDFLLSMLGPTEGVHLVGLYGMEARHPEGTVEHAPGTDSWRPVVADRAARLRQDAPVGVAIEEKGLTVTIHWRGAPEQAPWARAQAAAAEAEEGLVAQPGRQALELRPPLDVDKGTVIARLAVGYEAVGCFGDDLGDLAAFAALDVLARAGVAVARVAVVDPQSPPEVAAAADLEVEGPAKAVALLAALAEGAGP
jgi:trehalose 6-phosphate phosphatase